MRETAEDAGAPETASVPEESVHVDLSQGLAALGLARPGVATALSWRGVALGRLDLEARPRSMSEESLAGAVLEAIAPALDLYLVGRRVGHRRQLLRPEPDADPRRLLRVALSLLDQRPILAPAAAVAGPDDVAPDDDAEPPDVEPPAGRPARKRRSLLPNVALVGLLAAAFASCLAQDFAATHVAPMLLALAAAGIQVIAVLNVGKPAEVAPLPRR